MAVTETTARSLREIQPDDTDPATALFDLTYCARSPRASPLLSHRDTCAREFPAIAACA